MRTPTGAQSPGLPPTVQDTLLLGHEPLPGPHVHLLLVLRPGGHAYCWAHLQVYRVPRVRWGEAERRRGRGGETGDGNLGGRGGVKAKSQRRWGEWRGKHERLGQERREVLRL